MRFGESDAMRYSGAQFRMARAATGATFTYLCKALRMSPKTLAAIEYAVAVEYGVKEKGRFDEATVAKLVKFYERKGVRFLSTKGGEPSVAYGGKPPARKRGRGA